MSSTQPSYDSQWADPAPGLSCACSIQAPGIARVTVSGELDITTAPELDDVLAEAARGSVTVILDLSELTFMDSSGLHTILTARARFAAANCRLVLLKGRPEVQRVFELTGVNGVLEFVNARDARSLAAAQSS